MARNEEKHYGKLNRLLLQREKEEYLKKHPKRPRLDVLNTTEEIKEWLPSIKSDMNFYLKQSQVICYSEQKVMDYRLKVLQLEKEYKAFVCKMKTLNPADLDAVPWTHRPYKSKNEGVVTQNNVEDKTFTPIATPILDANPLPPANFVYGVELPLNNEPLEFNFKTSTKNIYEVYNNRKKINASNGTSDNKDLVSCSKDSVLVSKEQFNMGNSQVNCDKLSERASSDCDINMKSFKKLNHNETEINVHYLHSDSASPSKKCTESEISCFKTCVQDSEDSGNNTSISSKNILGLDYSLSSESDDSNL